MPYRILTTMKEKTKSRRDIHKQFERIEKIFYSIPNYEQKPFIDQMTLASAIEDQYHENIYYYLGDFNIDDEQEFMRRYDMQIPKSEYTRYKSSYMKYLLKQYNLLKN